MQQPIFNESYGGEQRPALREIRAGGSQRPAPLQSMQGGLPEKSSSATPGGCSNGHGYPQLQMPRVN